MRNKIKKNLWILSIIFLVACQNKEQIEISLEESNQIMSTSDDISLDEINQNNNQILNVDEGSVITSYICGAIKNPGVYTLDYGARIGDLVELALGFNENADDTYLNLAQKVEDGEKIYVPTKEETLSIRENEILGSIENEDGLININTASKDLLMGLPGIGESKAESIIHYRENEALFKSTEDLMNITGIKDGVYNKVKEYIKV